METRSRSKMKRAAIAGARSSVATEEERPWADLPRDLVPRISSAREMSLVDYTSLRAVCNPWHSTIPPATPLLIYTAAGPGLTPHFPAYFTAALSLPAQRPLEVRNSVLANGSTCVGSGYGWIAVDERVRRTPCLRLILVNPISGARIPLPDLMSETERTVKKVVFAPKPSMTNFTAVAIFKPCCTWRVAYTRSGDKKWTELALPPQEEIRKTMMVDLVYHNDGKLYGLTMSCGVHMIHIPGRDEARAARVEPLLPEENGSFPFDPDLVFAIPRFRRLYDDSSNNDKYLVFCEGNMYQVWRNLISMRRASLFGGLQDTELEKEIIVLKYDPVSLPCWREVNDLGGYSLFIGKNNAVSLRVVGTPWLRANCVYWIGGHEEPKAKVFDMATQITTLCVPDGDLEGFNNWASCWYFLTK